MKFFTNLFNTLFICLASIIMVGFGIISFFIAGSGLWYVFSDSRWWILLLAITLVLILFLYISWSADRQLEKNKKRREHRRITKGEKNLN